MTRLTEGCAVSTGSTSTASIDQPKLTRPRRISPHQALVALTLTGIVVGVGGWLVQGPWFAKVAWGVTTAIAIVPLTISLLNGLRAGRLGVDVIALLALAGSLLLQQYLAGAVIALMFATGRALEDYAGARAHRELSALLERAPRVVHRYEDGALTSPNLADIRAGDLLLVRPGEVVPVDGVVAGNIAVLDESALTGEAALVERKPGEQVQSGTLNAGGVFDLRAIATAERSTYAGIVRLVREAAASKAPLVRLADRYALFFLPVTLLLAALAWGISGQPIRALAVLVVATPCPLILAAPVAIVSGISRAARRGVIVKDGGALETLGRGTVLLVDKTGTLTAGMPAVAEVETFGDHNPNEVLRLAASLDQVSGHVLAMAIVRGAQEQGLSLTFPLDAVEQPGKGISGRVNGARVALGKGDWVMGGAPLPAAARSLRRRAALEGATNVFVTIGGALAGAIILDDPIRVDSPRTIRALRRAGIKRVVMVTGDHTDVAEMVGAVVGADHVLAERSPADKIEAVKSERTEGVTVMVGDGINDAPALAAADVGVAMGARGVSASSQAADIVITVDRLDRLAEAIQIARGARRIALQSVVAGMSLSLAAMAVAAAGFLPPLAGAFLQEAIDVAVILNALRALRVGGTRSGSVGAEGVQIAERFRSEHTELWPAVNRVRWVADRLDKLPPASARAELDELLRFFTERLVPHEQAEDAMAFPAVARLLGGEDPTGSMTRAHREITHLIRLFSRLLEDIPPEGPDQDDLRDLRRVLYGLFAIFRLHFAEENEAYLTLADRQMSA